MHVGEYTHVACSLITLFDFDNRQASSNSILSNGASDFLNLSQTNCPESNAIQ